MVYVNSKESRGSSTHAGGISTPDLSLPRPEQHLDLIAEREFAPRLAVIGDREPYNLEQIVSFGNYSPKSLRLCGIIVPGNDLDDQVISLMDRVEGMREHGQAHTIPDQNNNINFLFQGPNFDALYAHAPYDSKKLRSDPQYRGEYSKKLLRLISMTNPDLIFLSNFKVVLDRIVAQTYPDKIVNVHPSVLPNLKGFRPEHRATNLGEQPEANGYTIHFVNRTLDGGATLFQQQVPVEAINKEIASSMGETAYNKLREETARLRIIRAQSLWVPEVLAVAASNRERKVVQDADAFRAEGRPGFEKSRSYQLSLREDYKLWLDEHKENEVSMTFDAWCLSQRVPYQRVLFSNGLGFDTLEKILGAPTEAISEKLNGARCKFKFELAGALGISVLSEILEESRASDDAAHLSPMTIDKVQAIRDQARDVYVCTVFAYLDLSPYLLKRNILFEREELPTRVLAGRRNPFSESES